MINTEAPWVQYTIGTLTSLVEEFKNETRYKQEIVEKVRVELPGIKQINKK